MNYFNILEMLSTSYPSMRMIVDVTNQVANTEIEIQGKKGYRYTLSKVGWDLCFAVKFDDMVVDSIINFPQEKECEYSSRVLSLIKCYK